MSPPESVGGGISHGTLPRSQETSTCVVHLASVTTVATMETAMWLGMRRLLSHSHSHSQRRNVFLYCSQRAAWLLHPFFGLVDGELSAASCVLRGAFASAAKEDRRERRSGMRAS